jgi:hypothetical protein
MKLLRVSLRLAWLVAFVAPAVAADYFPPRGAWERRSPT